MDEQAGQNLAAAMNALAAAAAALPAAPATPAAPVAGPPLTSPCEGDTLALLSRLSAQLFCDGCTPLSSKFSGKVDDLQLFLADVQEPGQNVSLGSSNTWHPYLHGCRNYLPFT